MFIPFISQRSPLEKRRAGGGGRGGGGGGGGRSSGSSGSSGAGRASRPPAYSPGAPPPPYSVTGGRAVRGQPSSAGGGPSYTVGPGQVFAGRSAGGGTRAGVYGAGAGFAGGALIGGASFPFLFWPLAWGGAYNHYYGSGIYGPPANDSRPGGALSSYTLTRINASDQANFALYGDETSIEDMVPILSTQCGVASTPGPNITAIPSSAVQFYRGSSFALLLDGYNSTIPDVEANSSDNSSITVSTTQAPLPTTVDTTYLNCLNQTIGDNLGLLDSTAAATSAASLCMSPNQGLGLFALVVLLLRMV